MIRIDEIRELRRDLHMRPFEADRRVYLVFGADLLNEDAADALLKDLEEPPPYAVVVLVADELGPIPETIRSRCQLVPFRRLTERSIRTGRPRVLRRSPTSASGVARVAAGRLDRARAFARPRSGGAARRVARESRAPSTATRNSTASGAARGRSTPCASSRRRGPRASRRGRSPASS